MSSLEDRGAAASPFLCVGHSHVAALKKAAAARDLPIEAINFWDEPEGVVGGEAAASFAGAMVERIRREEGPVFSLIGGNPHIILGTLAHPRRFDFVLPEAPNLPLLEGAELLPTAAVRRLLADAATPYVRLLRQLARLCDGHVHHMESPPPSADSELIWKTVVWVRDWFPGMLEEVADPIFRYKMWRLHSHYIESICRPLGVEFVRAPSACQTPDGFMRSRFSEDGNHGNAAYGELVLAQMEERL